MAIVGGNHNPREPYSQEMVKWEAQNSEYGPAQRPYVYREYPSMMFLAGPPSGGMGAITIIEQVEVGGDNEADHYRQRGFRQKPLDAIDAYEAQQLEFARLAAEQNYDVKNRLSEKAGEEVRAAQAATSGHLPSVPVTGIKTRAKDKENS